MFKPILHFETVISEIAVSDYSIIIYLLYSIKIWSKVIDIQNCFTTFTSETTISEMAVSENHIQETKNRREYYEVLRKRK